MCVMVRYLHNVGLIIYKKYVEQHIQRYGINMELSG